MVLNYPGPYQLKFVIDAANIRTHLHHVNLNVDGSPLPGEDWLNINVTGHDGTVLSLDTVVQEYISAIAGLYDVTTTVSLDGLYSFAPNSFDSTFVSTSALSTAGTNAGNNETAHQLTLTFRTAEGGVARLQFMESAIGGTSNLLGSLISTGAVFNVATVFLSSSRSYLGRDTSRPIQWLRQLGGENEKLWRSYYRT